MNTFIQLIIKLFLRLIGQGDQKTSPPAKQQAPTAAVKPTPPPKPVAQEPVIPEPVEEEPPQPTTAETGPLAPGHGLQFNEIFDDATSGKLKAVLVSDGDAEGKFRFYKKGSWEGLYTGGQRPIGDFIQAEGDLLSELEMTQSSQNLLKAVSENEGKLEAINAYDGAFLSFGIFQWTLGTRDHAGELPALMKKLKGTYPETFEQYLGRYGLDIGEKTNSMTGYLTLQGELINTRALKQQFRSREWVYRFWRAGGDRKVQAIEVEHALSRLKSFYWRYKVHGFTLNNIITSEYGVALLLDNHVNLPGLVRRALRAAMNETGLTDPTNWGSEEERKVLNAYVQHRATKVEGVGPMYDAINRAKRTEKYVKENVISDERGTFRYSHTRSRGVGNYIPEPQGFDPSDYPDLETDMEGRDIEFLGGAGTPETD